MHVRRLSLTNICGIRNLDLHFPSGEHTPGSVLFIGRNGTGKSSVLRSIVLGLASEAEATALLAEPFGSPFVSVGQDRGTIEVELLGEDNKVKSLIKEIEKHGENDERVIARSGADLQQGPLVVAFGAGRSNEGAESSRSSYTLVDSAYMLFNYEGTFIQPELTLRRLKDYVGSKEYTRVLTRIRSALGLRRSDMLDFEKGGGVVVSGPYRKGPVPLHSWADGYRVSLNWLLDVYAWAMRRSDSIDSAGHVHGVLLVDEIEQHLHPSMQRGIIRALKVLFPRLQLFASTHSPLVVQGVKSNEIVSLHRKGSNVIATVLRDYSGFSVEDLLTAEELFETPPYSKGIERIRSRYRALMAKADLSKSERRELERCGRELAGLRMLSPLPYHEAETLGRWEARLSEVTDD